MSRPAHSALAKPELRYCQECGVDFMARDAQEKFRKTKRCVTLRKYEKNARAHVNSLNRKSRYSRDKSYYEPRRPFEREVDQTTRPIDKVVVAEPEAE